MLNDEALTVEVLWDRDVLLRRRRLPDISDGINLIAGMAGRMDLIRHDRQLTTRATDHIYLETEKITWPELTADLNLLVTDKEPIHEKVHGEEPKAYLGISFPDYEPGIAVVTTRDPLIRTTVAHELGHLLMVQHCEGPHCIMNSQPTYEKEPVKPWGYIAKVLLRDLVSYPTNIIEKSTNFCGECGDKAVKGAAELTRNKSFTTLL